MRGDDVEEQLFQDVLAHPVRHAILLGLVPLVRRVFTRTGGVPRLSIPTEVRQYLAQDALAEGEVLADASAAERRVYESRNTTSSTIYNLLWALKVPGGSKKPKSELLQHLRNANVNEEILSHAANFLAEDAIHKQMMQARPLSHAKFERSVCDRLRDQVNLQRRDELVEVLQDLEIFFFPFPANERAKVDLPDQIRRTRLLGMLPEDLETAILRRREVIHRFTSEGACDNVLRDLKSTYRAEAKSNRRRSSACQFREEVAEIEERRTGQSSRPQNRDSVRRSSRATVSSAPSTLLIEHDSDPGSSPRQLKRRAPHVLERHENPARRRSFQSEGSGLDDLTLEEQLLAPRTATSSSATRRSSEPSCSFSDEPPPRRGSYNDVLSASASLEGSTSQIWWLEMEEQELTLDRLPRMTREELRLEMRKHGLPAARTKKRMIELLSRNLMDQKTGKQLGKQLDTFKSSDNVSPTTQEQDTTQDLLGQTFPSDFFHSFEDDITPDALGRGKEAYELGIEGILDDALCLDPTPQVAHANQDGARKQNPFSDAALPEEWDWQAFFGSSTSTPTTAEVQRPPMSESDDSSRASWISPRSRISSEDWPGQSGVSNVFTAGARRSQDRNPVWHHGARIARKPKSRQSRQKPPAPDFGLPESVTTANSPWPSQGGIPLPVSALERHRAMKYPLQPRSRGQMFLESLISQEKCNPDGATSEGH